MDNEQLNQIPVESSPIVPQEPPQMEPKRGAINKVLIGVIVLAVLGVGAYAYFVKYNADNIAYETPTPTPTTTFQEPTPSISYSPIPTPRETVNYSVLTDVRWNTALQEISPTCSEAYGCDGIKTFVAGEVTSGAYKGSILYLNEIASLGTYYEHFTMQGDKQILFKNVKGIHDAPEYINFPLKAGHRLKKSYGVGTFFHQLKNPRKMFTDPILGDVYLDEDWKCFFVMLPDKTALAYDLDVSFVNRENGNLQATLNGTPTKESYEYTRIRGCAALCETLALVEEWVLKPTERLEVIGTTSTGEQMYRIKNPQDQVLKDLYNDKSTVAYYSDEGWQQLPKNKYTYDQFIAYNPLLYWKDSLGRWVEFKNKRFIVAAEMCKPVIYLYPKQTTDLTVKVYPNGGFTYTDPKYDNGWNVRANPDGKLTDLRTGKQHNYLFWEGIGLNYPENDKGWVIKREDVSSFIDDKLSLLGLRGRELDDFKAYWVNRLTEHPYYKLSFLTQEQFNEIAPLEVSQNPNTAIRILMTAEGLDSFRSIEPQELKAAPARTGFTLIEWGGVVLK